MRYSLLALLLVSSVAIAKGPDIDKVNGSISTDTVKSHVHNILEKLALHTRLEIARFAHTDDDYKQH